MKLSDDFDENSGGLPVAYMAVGVSLFFVVILAAVLLYNKSIAPKGNPSSAQAVAESRQAAAGTAAETEETVTGKTTSELLSGSKLTADQLDFWDMYPEETAAAETESAKETEETETDPAEDGKHTLIIDDNGKEQWVSINPYLKQNSYDFEGLVYQYPVMKYFENSVKKSYMGVDISKRNDQVDFIKLKRAGADFVMIRVGARGYGSGQLVLDEKFDENMKAALDAGLQVGAYFYSQAINEEEVMEEVATVVEALKDYKITYPVAFDMELVENDTARIESLTRKDKTNIAKTFLDSMMREGYKTMLYGTKEWLITKLDLTKLEGYDIWLSQQADVPDYPYQFTMWQYAFDGKIDGISGNANFNISFVDYSEK